MLLVDLAAFLLQIEKSQGKPGKMSIQEGC